MSHTMTEEQIERRAELAMDALDSRLMAGSIGQAAYNVSVRKIDNDTATALAFMRRA